jgi:hypothetical protein
LITPACLLLGDDDADGDPDGLARAADFELLVAREKLARGGGLQEAVGAGDEDAAAWGDLVADLAGDGGLADRERPTPWIAALSSSGLRRRGRRCASYPGPGMDVRQVMSSTV